MKISGALGEGPEAAEFWRCCSRRLEQIAGFFVSFQGVEYAGERVENGDVFAIGQFVRLAGLGQVRLIGLSR